MPFQRIDSEKLSKSVVRQVEQLILRGILRPGERLPSEPYIKITSFIIYITMRTSMLYFKILIVSKPTLYTILKLFVPSYILTNT